MSTHSNLKKTNSNSNNHISNKSSTQMTLTKEDFGVDYEQMLKRQDQIENEMKE